MINECNLLNQSVFLALISPQDRPAQAIYQPRSRPRANEEAAARNSGG